MILVCTLDSILCLTDPPKFDDCKNLNSIKSRGLLQFLESEDLVLLRSTDRGPIVHALEFFISGKMVNNSFQFEFVVTIVFVLRIFTTFNFAIVDEKAALLSYFSSLI